jgi:hypothetical protein
MEYLRGIGVEITRPLQHVPPKDAACSDAIPSGTMDSHATRSR